MRRSGRGGGGREGRDARTASTPPRGRPSNTHTDTQRRIRTRARAKGAAHRTYLHAVLQCDVVKGNAVQDRLHHPPASAPPTAPSAAAAAASTLLLLRLPPILPLLLLLLPGVRPPSSTRTAVAATSEFVCTLKVTTACASARQHKPAGRACLSAERRVLRLALRGGQGMEGGEEEAAQHPASVV